MPAAKRIDQPVAGKYVRKKIKPLTFNPWLELFATVSLLR
jgi:hypothetical protein